MSVPAFRTALLTLAIAAGSAVGVSPALADGSPTKTVSRAVYSHFGARTVSVGSISCTRPSNVVALCSAIAKVKKAGKVVTYRVKIRVNIPLDGAASSKITSVTRA